MEQHATILEPLRYLKSTFHAAVSDTLSGEQRNESRFLAQGTGQMFKQIQLCELILQQTDIWRGLMEQGPA